MKNKPLLAALTLMGLLAIQCQAQVKSPTPKTKNMDQKSPVYSHTDTSKVNLGDTLDLNPEGLLDRLHHELRSAV